MLLILNIKSDRLIPFQDNPNHTKKNKNNLEFQM
jgi:hypothetical protein